jgi:hypothetical protein
MTPLATHSLFDRIRIAALGISLGATLVIGAVELRLPIGGERMEQAAANVSLIALAVWLACRVWQR